MQFDPKLIDVEKVPGFGENESVTTSFNLSSDAEWLLEQLADWSRLSQRDFLDRFAVSFQNHLTDPRVAENARSVGESEESGSNRKSRVVTSRTLQVLEKCAPMLNLSRDKTLETLIRFSHAALLRRKEHEQEQTLSAEETIRNALNTVRELLEREDYEVYQGDAVNLIEAGLEDFSALGSKLFDDIAFLRGLYSSDATSEVGIKSGKAGQTSTRRGRKPGRKSP